MTDIIKCIIDKFELGYVFTVTDFPMTVEFVQQKITSFIAEFLIATNQAEAIREYGLKKTV